MICHRMHPSEPLQEPLPSILYTISLVSIAKINNLLQLVDTSERVLPHSL